MMTVTTHVELRPGAEPQWDEAMRARLEAASNEAGWIGGQLLIPLDALNSRVIVGTWETRADWERWHQSEAFAATREQLADLEIASQQTRWYETIFLGGRGRHPTEGGR
jgi:heme-degrading monooxygenase HmoA